MISNHSAPTLSELCQRPAPKEKRNHSGKEPHQDPVYKRGYTAGYIAGKKANRRTCEWQARVYRARQEGIHIGEYRAAQRARREAAKEGK